MFLLSQLRRHNKAIIQVWNLSQDFSGPLTLINNQKLIDFTFGWAHWLIFIWPLSSCQNGNELCVVMKQEKLLSSLHNVFSDLEASCLTARKINTIRSMETFCHFSSGSSRQVQLVPIWKKHVSSLIRTLSSHLSSVRRCFKVQGSCRLFFFVKKWFYFP